ncbi:hypothetical protein SEA_VASANTI_71 [Gordonia phage Vasanti]|uniref:Uncharacterized protein n=1 Tax=Gordonia phage Vasanti TaxID=2502431 RepID=A0A411BW36_9CAUD|nr:hypothetical protein PP493_gp71 [Gordonia phage Vasanti]QAY05809.1 hypothetical protein SEA_VASANTI_71 [Gordonia phage Vasanti]
MHRRPTDPTLTRQLCQQQSNATQLNEDSGGNTRSNEPDSSPNTSTAHPAGGAANPCTRPKHSPPTTPTPEHTAAPPPTDSSTTSATKNAETAAETTNDPHSSNSAADTPPTASTGGDQ